MKLEFSRQIFEKCSTIRGHAVVQFVKALRYKPKGHGFNSRCCHWIFHWHNPSGRTVGPGVDSASNRNEYQEYFLGRLRRPVRRADNLTTFTCRLSWNPGASTSWNPLGLLCFTTNIKFHEKSVLWERGYLMRTDGHTWRSFSCVETDSDLCIHTEKFVVTAESFPARNKVDHPTPVLSLFVSQIIFPLLNTIIVSEYKSSEDSYLVSSASNLPSCVSRCSLQVLFYEFIPLLKFAECLLFSLIRYSLGVRTFFFFFFLSPWQRDVVPDCGTRRLRQWFQKSQRSDILKEEKFENARN